jgi:hypothetical protein
MAASERSLLLAMEQNLAERACHLHREMAGATVIRAEDLVIADSGLDDHTAVLQASAEGERLSRRLGFRSAGI